MSAPSFVYGYGMNSIDFFTNGNMQLFTETVLMSIFDGLTDKVYRVSITAHVTVYDPALLPNCAVRDFWDAV